MMANHLVVQHSLLIKVTDIVRKLVQQSDCGLVVLRCAHTYTSCLPIPQGPLKVTRLSGGNSSQQALSEVEGIQNTRTMNPSIFRYFLTQPPRSSQPPRSWPHRL